MRGKKNRDRGSRYFIQNYSWWVNDDVENSKGDLYFGFQCIFKKIFESFPVLYPLSPHFVHLWTNELKTWRLWIIVFVHFFASNIFRFNYNFFNYFKLKCQFRVFVFVCKLPFLNVLFVIRYQILLIFLI